MKEKVKRGAGRPPSFTSPEDMEAKFEGYLKECEEREVAPSMLGLCKFCRICFDTLNEYLLHKGDRYSETIKKYKDWIYADKIALASAGKANVAITIFDAVNNHGMFNTRTDNKNKNDVTVNGTLTLEEAIKANQQAREKE